MPRRTLLARLLGTLAACASNKVASSAPVAAGVSLKGGKLVVYSFLDVREHGKHINTWKDDEDLAERAKGFVDGFVAELHTSGLV